ncbi:hypothetical protein BU24DRAFT_420916 [Aaosphaeria arxii CBS 175.79]|uniref:DNA helicase n=1 Tax=Aaosphaeria arxii CBS 175.79 TaxID=1450172 RepID=A0A6A5XZX3_9PLEO|nr:uncharacterized protein BU24DRAFT_420916 [Aaosphaeria arxii CBS 175.79]KAF2017854.1 hypothetical protein BU24DRAFT_420916 [Aaosphaeria arxii CBS 175.79]
MGADVQIVKEDETPQPPSEVILDPDTTAVVNDDALSIEAELIPIKKEEELSGENGDDGGVAQRPAKRRRLDELTPRRSASRAVSPPWKSFAADGPTTIINNGVRKSTRFSKETPTATPEPAKRSTRHATKTAQTNGTPKNQGSVKKNGIRPAPGSSSQAKGKTVSDLKRKTSTASLKSPAPTPASRKSTRQRNSSIANAQTSSSPVQEQQSPDSVRRRPGRPRRVPQPPPDELLDADLPEPGSPYNDQDDIVGDSSGPAPRLRLRLRRAEVPNRHPQHAPPPTKFDSFTSWLRSDDPLEGEEGQRLTEDKVREEAERRMQIAEAAESGILSRSRCSIFAPEPAEEPPPRYGHWDHVVAHALHFNKLLKNEQFTHRRQARTLAREAVDYWKTKYKRKTQDEMDQEESDRALLRYKQIVKDVKDTWANVKVEIDKERVAKWEEQQLQLGHKAMDDMFNQAQEILGRGAADSVSYVSDDRASEEGDFESRDSHAGNDERDDDDVMSMDSDSEEGDINDEDANLTAEQLRAKYEQLPDLPNDSEDEEGSEGEDDEEVEDQAEDRTPEPTPDPDIDIENTSDSATNSLSKTNGYHDDPEDEPKRVDNIDPATVELDLVDEALLDTEDEDGGSASGSEEWPSDEDEEQSDEDDGFDSGSEDEGGDLGVMGFLSASEIKKMKEAAKTILDKETKAEGDEVADAMEVVEAGPTNDNKSTVGEQPSVPSPHSNGVNGHHPDQQLEEAKSEVQEQLTTTDGRDTDQKNGETSADKPKSSIEDRDEDMDDVAMAPSKSQSRSRHSSSPPRTEIPSLLRGTLREYQHDGLDWLANLYDTDTNGILADEMGLGKTIQTISLLAYIAVNRQAWGPHLVVVPTSVMLNWEMEFKKWCPGFKILTYYGDINERKRKRAGWRTTGRDMYNVVITSYQLILQDAAAFKMRAWQYLILDEAHNIKNFKSQRWQTMLNLRTEHRLLLTGTPLQNNIDELWSLLYFLMPAGFAGEGRIAGLEEFTMALKNPTSQILDQGRQQLDAEAQKIVKKLHEVLRPYLLRRLKADVEKQMPAKYEHVVYCKLSKRQRQLYDGFMGRASTKQILSSGNYMSIINCLMSLRKVCNHPDLFETRAIVTSMAMPKSVTAAYEIKSLLVQKRLYENQEETVNLDALNLLFARREQSSMLHARRAQHIRATRPLQDLIEVHTRRLNPPTPAPAHSLQATLATMAHRQAVEVRDHLQTCLRLTRARTMFRPIYGKGLIDRLSIDYQDYAFGAHYQAPSRGDMGEDPSDWIQPNDHGPMLRKGNLGFRAPLNPLRASEWYQRQVSLFQELVPTMEQRAESMHSLLTTFTCVTPAVAAEELAPLSLSKPGVRMVRASQMAQHLDPFHEPRIRQSIAFPDKRLLQYDCGKLQRLAGLLRELQAGGHRALIFTQMTKVLDILEQFLNIHGHRYLRLDGATKVEQRQILTDRFNNDPRILCFILSSRSGGLGINLTGADTVIFYDLDWNPAMDKQCQDRSHRIGQTRDVHIYKFVSEYTIEANILRKSNQKRLLDDVIIQKGDFTTDYFNKVTWRDALEGSEPVDEAGAAMDRVLGERAGLLGDSKVMRSVEDTEDQNAANIAQKEIVDEIHDDQVDFNESSNTTPKGGATRQPSEAGQKDDAEHRHVDEYMLDLYREEYGKEPYKPPTDRQKRNRKGQDVHRTNRKKKY